MLYCLISLCLFSVLGHGQPQVVKISMGNFEPYFIAEGETGIFTDILKLVFAELPEYQPHYLFGSSNNRLILEYQKGNVDAVSNLFDAIPLDACRSDLFFRFRPFVVSLRNRNITINHVNDLSQYSIITFQGAKKFLGEGVSRYMNDEAYRELGKPAWQVRVLKDGKADVSIGDLFIFLHSAQNINGFALTDFNYHDVLPIITSRMGFRDPALCSAFNNALAKVKASGAYDGVYTKYLKQYQLDTILNP